MSGTNESKEEALAATDELDDFESVALCKLRFGPLGPRQDFQVPLDRDAAGVETQFAEQVHDSSARFCGPIFPVYHNRDFHVHLYPAFETDEFDRN
jgi:hypothetical protein